MCLDVCHFRMAFLYRVIRLKKNYRSKPIKALNDVIAEQFNGITKEIRDDSFLLNSLFFDNSIDTIYIVSNNSTEKESKYKMLKRGN